MRFQSRGQLCCRDRFFPPLLSPGVELDPRDRATFVARAKCLENVHKYPEALKNYASAEALLSNVDVRATEIIKLKAALETKMGKHQEAIKNCDHALAIDNNDAEYHF